MYLTKQEAAQAIKTRILWQRSGKAVESTGRSLISGSIPGIYLKRNKQIKFIHIILAMLIWFSLEGQTLTH